MWKRLLPKSLYGRVALIVILPIFLMQSVITWVFFDRHWDTVTANQSANVAGQIGLLTKLYEKADTPEARAAVVAMAYEDLDISTRFQPGKGLPERNKLSPFTLYNATLNRQLTEELDRDFWFDTRSWPGYIEIRVESGDGYLVFLPLRDRVFATTGPVFVLWLIGTSLLLGSIAIVFLRNQVRSILKLANAAEAFGRGRDMPEFRPTGATEVRRAGRAFIAMRERIKRHLAQRTTMLAGVSHDLRTVLTRFKLELALIDSPETEPMKKDVDEMARMLEAYLAFARGDSGEVAQPTDMAMALEELRSDAERHGHTATVTFHGLPVVTVKPASFKRCLANLVSNAARHARTISITGHRDHRYLTVTVDDDGPGIPLNMREEVFKPFLRLDDARNQDEGGSGLGLAIARDIARSHGGDITLGDSPMGGLRATVRVPV